MVECRRRRVRARARAWSVAAAVLVAVPSSTRAQDLFESAGERALGMGGAFVAVADDASATHWNPAGLALGAPAAATIGGSRFQFGNRKGPLFAGASRGQTSLTSFGSLPVGLSYGTFARSRVRLEPADGLHIDRLTLQHAGISVLQSVTDGLIVGSTVRILRGGFGTSAASLGPLGDAFDEADTMSVGRHTTVDADVALMATAPRARVGLMWRNLRSVSFAAISGRRVTLPRQARVGGALLPTDGVTLAIDLDLNTVDLMGDLRRMCALGGEARLGSRFVVRAGLRWNLAVTSGPIGAVGASVALRRGLWLDGHLASGRSDQGREVGVAVRAGL